MLDIQLICDKQQAVEVLIWDDFQKTNSSFVAVTRSHHICKYRLIWLT